MLFSLFHHVLHLFHDTQEVTSPDFPDVLFAVTAGEQLAGELQQFGRVAQTADATVAVGAVVIARDDVPEQDVYNFVSGIFENVDELKQAHDKANELDLDFASSVTSVPYHPGAAKYFSEKGFSVATK